MYRGNQVGFWTYKKAKSFSLCTTKEISVSPKIDKDKPMSFVLIKGVGGRDNEN